MTLKEKESAPALVLPDQEGTQVSLAALKGKWVLVYFYPKDDTPGCVKEACGIRDQWGEFAKAGVVVLGISPDDPESHTRFIGKYKLPFTLLADEHRTAAKAFGAWGKKSFMGKKYMGILRSSFLVAPDGTIAKIYKEVKPETHAQDILRDLALFASDA